MALDCAAQEYPAAVGGVLSIGKAVWCASGVPQAGKTCAPAAQNSLHGSFGCRQFMRHVFMMQRYEAMRYQNEFNSINFKE